MKAGFDLSDMRSANWKVLLEEFNLDTVAKTDNGWYWTDSNSRNFVVTANNPITGDYYVDNRRSKNLDYLSYVGIEGDASFVAEFFTRFKELADNIKDEEFGRRGFI